MNKQHTFTDNSILTLEKLPGGTLIQVSIEKVDGLKIRSRYFRRGACAERTYKQWLREYALDLEGFNTL